MAAICRSTIIKEGTPFTSEWSLRSLRNSHAVYVGIYIPFISEWLRRSAGICITKEDAYRIASKQYGVPAFKSAEEKTPHEAYAHGYAQGHIDGYNGGYNQAIFDVDSHQISEDDYLQCIEKYCMENRIDYDRGDDDEDYDCSEHCDMFDIGFKQGYKQGYEDYYEEAANRKREYPEELYLEAAPFNAIEAIKDEIREIAYTSKVDKSINDACWKVIDHLMTLEKELAGNAVIEQYLIEDSI